MLARLQGKPLAGKLGTVSTGEHDWKARLFLAHRGRELVAALSWQKQGPAPAGPAASPADTEVQRSSLIAALTGTLGDRHNGQRVRDLFDEEDVGGADLDRLLNKVDGVQIASNAPTGPRRASAAARRADIGDLATAHIGGSLVSLAAAGNSGREGPCLSPRQRLIHAF